MLTIPVYAQLSSSAESAAFPVDLVTPPYGPLWPEGGGSNDWMTLPWFGEFGTPSDEGIHHTEHGWLFAVGQDSSSIYIYDYALDLWGWTSDSYYPWIYFFDAGNKWTYYRGGGQPGERWFNSAGESNWTREDSLLSDLAPQGMVLVDGGSIGLYRLYMEDPWEPIVRTVERFAIAETETTWGEWKAVRAWASANGYDIGESGAGCADDHPVHSVTWYEVIKWCNAKSEMDGLMPVYSVEGTLYKNDEEDLVVMDPFANGYRLPSTAEWEIAASGGNLSNGYTYAGGDDLDEVGWYSFNSSGASCSLWDGYGTWPVGQKLPNELGLYDMSGNVEEWVFDFESSYRGHEESRESRGGSWSTGSLWSTVDSYMAYFPFLDYNTVGFRVAMSP